jgi:hypothetical protein
MARPMTVAEKARFKSFFPALDVNKAVVTDGPSMAYNCIAWTVGITNRWIWPGSSLASFDTFYQGFGFVRAGDGPIAAWGQSTSKMTHGCVSGIGHGTRWESKCGADLRIQHGLAELVGSVYGRAIAFYRPSRVVTVMNQPVAELVMKEKTARSYLSAAQRRQLAGEIERLPAALRTAYASAFSAWKQTWFSGGLAISSDPHTRAIGQEYDALIAMGPAIIPLVVETLADPENFLALQLYDAVQSNEQLLVQFGPEDERIVEGEQGRANRVVRAWFANR